MAETPEQTIERLREERNWLINECQRIAAPHGFTSSGTLYSASHNVEEYVKTLQLAIRQIVEAWEGGKLSRAVNEAASLLPEAP